MKHRHIKAMVLGMTGLMAAGFVQAADIEAGKAKSVLCVACHGADGNSVNVIWPNLAGQHASYTEKQLKEFKAGKRINATMQGMVAALTEEDMANLAAYYESQTPKAPKFDQSLLAHGQ